MPEHLRALVVVLLLALLVFTFGNRLACTLSITEKDYTRRRNLWFCVTLVAFLAHNFWIFLILTGLIITHGVRHELNKLALYFFLFSALPMVIGRITVLDVYIIDIHYGRLLAIAILLPALVELNNVSPKVPRFGYHVQDKILLAFLVLLFLLHLQVDETFPNKLRNYVIYPFIDVFLPYYIASRTLNTLRDFRDTLISFSMPCIILAFVAVFECGRHWLLYTALVEALGSSGEYGKYLARGNSLRALGTAGQPIALGYELTVAFGIFLYFGKTAGGILAWRLGLAALVAGIVAALSRGPWVGAVVMCYIFVITGPRAISNLAKLGFVFSVIVAITAGTPAWDKVVSHLPFVGTIDAENIEFRENLLVKGIDIVLENPLLGSRALDLEQFRTGEGIIDLVNTYLVVGLKSGLTGLGLFTMFFFTICFGIYRGMRRLPNKDDERHRLGQALLAVLVGILIIICTVSSITVVPYIYWSIAGVGVAYIRLVSQPIAE